MRISDWSSDVCSSDLPLAERRRAAVAHGLRCVRELGDAPADRVLFVSSLPDDAALLAAAAGIAAHPGDSHAWIDTSSVSLSASPDAAATAARAGKIGRASCRESGGKSV